jgi:hypothetical protein
MMAAMTPKPCTALGAFALILLAILWSCAPEGVRADDEARIRWEYKLVAVSDLVGDAAISLEELSGQALIGLMALAAGSEETLREAAGGEEVVNEAKSFQGRVKQADAALLRSLNELGADGWEVVWMDKGQVLLKRRAA